MEGYSVNSKNFNRVINGSEEKFVNIFILFNGINVSDYKSLNLIFNIELENFRQFTVSN